MKILHTSDWHVDGGLNYGNQEQRFQDRIVILDSMIDRAMKEKCVIFLHAGDITNTPHPSTKTIRELQKIVRRITDAGIHFVDISGNHESHRTSDRPPVGKLLEEINPKMVHIFTKAEFKEIAGVQIAGMPWIHRSQVQAQERFAGLSKEELNAEISKMATELMETMIAQADAKKPLVCAAHCTINGAVMGQEREVMIGTDFSLPHVIFEDKKVNYCALGHIHKAQEVGRPWIRYSGSPDRVSFGEKDEEKSFVIVDTEKSREENCFIISTNAREFKEITENYHADFEKISFDSIKDKIAKIKITGTKKEIDSFDFNELEEDVKKAKPFHYQIVREVTRDDRERGESQHYDQMRPLQIVEAWSTKKRLKKDEKQTLLKNAEELLSTISEKGEKVENHGGFIPLSLELNNFKRHKETRIKFAEISLAAISGQNGAGKSSLLEALAWSVWGISPSSSDDDLVRQGQKNMSVRFQFLIGDDCYEVIRKRTVSGKSSSGVLEFMKGGKAITKGGIKETQQQIIDAVGMSASVFFASAYFRQGDASNFTSAKPTERKTILTDILSLSIWTELEEAAKDKERELKGKIQMFEGKFEILEKESAEKELFEKSLEQSEEHLKRSKNDITEKQKTVSLLEEQSKDETLTQERRTLAEKEVQRIKKDKENIEEEEKSIQSNIEKWEEILSNSESIRSDAQKVEFFEKEKKKHEEEYFQYKEEINKREKVLLKREKLENEIQFLKEKLKEVQDQGMRIKGQLAEAGTDCPTCGAHKEHQHKNPHTEKEEERTLLREKWGKINKESLLLQEELIAIEIPEEPQKIEATDKDMEEGFQKAQDAAKKLPQLESVEERKKELLEKYEELQEKRLDVNKDYTEAQTRLSNIPELNTNNIEKLEKEKEVLIGLKEEYDALSNKCAVTRENIERCKKKGLELKELKKENEELIKTSAAYKQLVEATGKKGAPTLIIEGILPEIEETTNEILKKISNSSLRVRFDTLRMKKSATKKQQEEGINSMSETLDIWIEDEQGEREYSNFSGGERFRVDFAIRIALSKILARRSGTQIRFMIIDEGLGALDDDGKVAFIQSVQTVSKDFDTVLVISHIPDVVEAFGTVIRVEREDGHSKVSIL